jgi:predicted negative regulator of RcsB-dependent stress response
VTTHYEDEAQAERLKQWWKDNWMALAGGLVIGLAGIFGWEGWNSHQAGRAAEASRMYEDLRVAISASNADTATQIGDALIKDHAKSPYASGAAMYLAAEAVKAGQLDVALTRLRWVRENGSDDGLRQVARLREARVLWQQDQADAALKLLDGGDESFATVTEELRGDIRLSQGDRAAARAAYEKALAGADEEDAAARGDLQRKIDDLSDVVPS